MLQEVTLTILVTNRTYEERYLVENGLCIHVATPEGDFLFDTGQKRAFIYNAVQMGIDLAAVKAIFLSHGHDDHTGGLYHYLKTYGGTTVVAHPNIFIPKFQLINGERLDIGIPYTHEELEELGAQFVLTGKPHALSENVLSSGEIPRVTTYEKPDEVYQERIQESYITDPLHDDMALILKTSKGLIVLLGCGHSGVINTLKHAIRLTGEERIYAVMGGFHLLNASQEKIHRIALELQKLSPQYIVPLNCTGARAAIHLAKIFPERVLHCYVGDRLTLEFVTVH
ncbi:MAG: MBL fold metallo-hydrolase [Calditrichaeota bacterium]|nr:MAG: MBL fold metallo-hydrolase [Calditrichota bacterium]